MLGVEVGAGSRVKQGFWFRVSGFGFGVQGLTFQGCRLLSTKYGLRFTIYYLGCGCHLLARLLPRCKAAGPQASSLR
jgi:hypothetical protein